jgi:uncharacterized HAD superfamily protein
LNIGLDFDGVYANSHILKPIVANKRFGVDIPAENFRRKLVVESGLLTLEQYILVGREAMVGLHPIPLVDGATMYVKTLLAEKHSIRFITSRTEEFLEAAKKILCENGISLPIQGIGYGLSKTDACQSLDLYVDDDLEKLLPLSGKVEHLLFFSWPWNLYEKEPKEIQRVSSWWEIYNYIWDEI